MNNLRPTTLNDLIGQTKIIRMLRIMIASAKSRSDALPHMLFNGPPGLGKTTLSQAIANDMDVGIQIANGGAVNTIEKITPYIMRIEKGDVLFIDEIHRISNAVSEFLYPVMEDFRCDIGGKERKISHDVPIFTLVGATTEAGSLEPPLYDRFVAQFQLEPYDVDELTELLMMNAPKLSLAANKQALNEIAKRGRGTPRIANNLLRWVRDYCTAHNKPLNANVVGLAMDLKGIDDAGMTPKDRKYLEVLNSVQKPLGLNTIISMTGIDKQTIEGIIEPFLLRKKMILKTSKGRVAI